MRILLVRLSALGDVVMGLHVLSTLRTRFCSAFVGWLVEDRFAPLLRDHPELDALHVYPRRRLRRPWNWWRIPGFIHQLRKPRYDLVLDLQGNLKSGVLARLSGAKRRVGLDAPLSREGNRLFVRERVAPPAGHRIDAFRALVDAACGPGPWVPATLAGHGRPHGAIVLHPSTSRFGAFKRWPAARFAALGDRLAERTGAPLLITAGPGERVQAEAVAAALRGPAEVIEPVDLPALVDLLGGARLVVAGDTGPAHIAAVLGVATVSLFGPKDPSVLGPVGPRVRAVTAGVRCSPCALRDCPDPVCMTALPVDLVEQNAMELLRLDG